MERQGKVVGLDDSDKILGHGGLAVRTLVLALLVFYPPFNTSQTLDPGSCSGPGRVVMSKQDRRCVSANPVVGQQRKEWGECGGACLRGA